MWNENVEEKKNFFSQIIIEWADGWWLGATTNKQKNRVEYILMIWKKSLFDQNIKY